MSYSNVVFKQQITRNVNRDEIEHQRIDDRSNSPPMQSASRHASKLQAPSSTTLLNSPPSTSQVLPPHPDQERFNKNHEVNDRLKRENDKEKLDNFYNARLQKRLEREDQKWQKEAEKSNKEEEKRLYHQKVLIDNKKNSNG